MLIKGKYVYISTYYPHVMSYPVFTGIVINT